jgi:hypothetical protein
VAVTERSRARVIYRLPDQRASRAAGPAVAPTRLSLLLLALVLFSGGLVLGRGSARTGDTAESPAPSQATAATAPALSPPASADAPAGGTARAGVGPDHTVAGVGVGWARTREGAAAAATNYTKVLGGQLLFDDARRHQAITQLAAPRAKVALLRASDEAAELTRKGLHLPAGAAGAAQAIMVTVPVGEKVERYDSSSARVAILTTGLAGSAAGVQVSQGWGVTVVDLEWVRGDWKQVAVTSRAAAIPLATGDEVPSSADQFLEQARQFKEYDYAPRP